MKEYWMEFLIAAYVFTSIDIILTARGILYYGMHEGNALVTSIVPNDSPFLIPYMVISTMCAFWFVFYTCSRPLFNQKILELVSFLSLAAVGTHTFGISTWIFL